MFDAPAEPFAETRWLWNASEQRPVMLVDSWHRAERN
jgi:hypothetical protein